MDGTDIDNMSRETENEYVIMKYNWKELQEMCEDHPDYEELLTRKNHEWNWYHWNRNLRRPIHEQCM
eukprot:6704039-Ditylum_brightwellii.AAC.1